LGLPASASASPAVSRSGSPLASPSPGYITPPRYHRRLSSNNSSGSNNSGGSTDRRSISANYASTPGSGNRHNLGFSPSPTTTQTQPKPNMPYSYSPAGDRGSPLFHKAIERQQRRQSQSDFDTSGLSTGRGSFGESSGLGLGRSQSVKAGAPAAAAKKGVNFKWLYDQEYNLAGGGYKRSSIGAAGGGRGLSSSQSMHF
jgi:hypothetical protein